VKDECKGTGLVRGRSRRPTSIKKKKKKGKEKSEQIGEDHDLEDSILCSLPLEEGGETARSLLPLRSKGEERGGRGGGLGRVLSPKRGRRRKRRRKLKEGR